MRIKSRLNKIEITVKNSRHKKVALCEMLDDGTYVVGGRFNENVERQEYKTEKEVRSALGLDEDDSLIAIHIVA